MPPETRPPLVIWRLIDGKPGHEKQTTGLAQAIARLTPARIHSLRAPDLLPCLRDLILKRCTGAEKLPAPDLILGAGHSTHLALLAARRARGGKAICLMRPSLPLGLFDLCLIPNHDRPPARDNVIATRGVLNAVVPSDRHDLKRGLFLIGGTSSHYHWGNAEVARQVLTLAREHPDIQWQLTTSRRTPEDFVDHLEAERPNNLSLHPHTETPPGWLEAALAEAGSCWVTEDSVSMVYEAFTAGCTVGLLRLPSHRPSRIGRGVDELIAERRVTPFEDRQRRSGIHTQDGRFDEAERCARVILRRWTR